MIVFGLKNCKSSPYKNVFVGFEMILLLLGILLYVFRAARVCKWNQFKDIIGLIDGHNIVKSYAENTTNNHYNKNAKEYTYIKSDTLFKSVFTSI